MRFLVFLFLVVSGLARAGETNLVSARVWTQNVTNTVGFLRGVSWEDSNFKPEAHYPQTETSEVYRLTMVEVFGKTVELKREFLFAYEVTTSFEIKTNVSRKVLVEEDRRSGNFGWVATGLTVTNVGYISKMPRAGGSAR
jgi:hypothetical protein